MIRRLKILRGYTGPETKFAHIPDGAIVLIGGMTDAVQRQVSDQLADFLLRHEYAIEIVALPATAESATEVPDDDDETPDETVAPKRTGRRKVSRSAD